MGNIDRVLMVGLVLGCCLSSIATETTFIGNKTYECPVTEKGGKYYVNCSSRGLKKIPELPKFAMSVDLSNNEIINILSEAAFFGMDELLELDLSYNPLENILPTAFRGLKNLTSLYMRESRLFVPKDLVLDTLLYGLNSLRNFSFTFTKGRGSTPFDCSVTHYRQPFWKVDKLLSIETLEIDSALLKWRNGTGDKSIYNTTHLHFINGWICFYPFLSKDVFKYFPLLQTFTLSCPFIKGHIMNDFVTFQTNLKHLTLYGSSSYNEKMLGLLYNVTTAISNMQSMESLTFQDFTKHRGTLVSCIFQIYNLTEARNLQTLNLVGNSIWLYTPEGCTGFPKSLKHLVLDRNCFTSEMINKDVLRFNKQITSIHAKDQNSCAFTSKYSRSEITAKSEDSTGVVFDLEKLVLTNTNDQLVFGYSSDLYKSLKYLDLSQNDKDSHLINTIVPYFFSASRPVLEYLNMSKCRIIDLQKDSFSSFRELKYLDLSSNILGEMNCVFYEILVNLKNLEVLNISKNNIECTVSSMFETLTNVKEIILALNRIEHLDVSLSQLKSLKYLDLSYNKLHDFTDRVMKDLDSLAMTKQIQVDLSGNALFCTCDTVEFLRWIIYTKVILIGRDTYTCSYSNGSIARFIELPHIIEALSSECASKTILIVSVSSAIACCVAAVSAVTAYRCRWRLRYWYYKTKIKIPYQTRGHNYEQLFEFDMFISYSSEDHEIARQGTMDKLESKRGLKCCIHERDFKAGESIAFNIAQGIRESKRTALFLSKSFLKSEWCMYELNIARMEALHTGRNVILMVMLENLPSKALPIDVLDVINAFTYLEYPRDETENDLEVFWNKCADFANDS